MNTLLQIDGSMLEGGGQILRNAAALAAITGRSIQVDKIRAGRSRPGLAAQHMTGLQLVTSICGGDLQGACVGSSSITLHTQQLTAGYYTADTKTAGSCCLLIQTALPCLLYATSAYDGSSAGGQAAPLPAAPAASDFSFTEVDCPPKRMKSAEGTPSIPSSSTPNSVTTNTTHMSTSTNGPSSRQVEFSGCHDETALQQAAQGAFDQTGPMAGGEECPPVHSTLKLIGGTDAAMAPPVGYIVEVLVPTLKRLYPGLELSVDLLQRGFYPRGGGHLSVTAKALPTGATLQPFKLTDFGKVQAVHVKAFTAGRKPVSLAHAMAEAATKGVRRMLRKVPSNRMAKPPGSGSVEVGAVTSTQTGSTSSTLPEHNQNNASSQRYRTCSTSAETKQPQRHEVDLTVSDVSGVELTTEVWYEKCGGDGGGLSITIYTTSGCILGSNAVLDRNSVAEVMADQCVTEVESYLEAGACVDQWMQDQLIIFMALSEGESMYACTEPTLHTRTAMVISEMMTQAKFTVIRPANAQQGLWHVKCQGASIRKSCGH